MKKVQILFIFKLNYKEVKMLGFLLQILPVVIYKWLAKRFCETTKIGNSDWVIASKDILIKKDQKEKKNRIYNF